ncbi:helix-turn-helix domain-containing protein [Niallia sp. XMNu-256]|uniref:PucR family transcriptional regulator n=1 Tax=Niallia sp. XMNu-256 TaxID=3082444 RepID=UPI0030CBFB33
MLKKLTSYFANAIATNRPPVIYDENYYWFKETDSEPFWLGVPKTELSQEQLDLLSTLYEWIRSPYSLQLTESAREWYSYIFEDKKFPKVDLDTSIRFIQFQIKRLDQDMNELIIAINEFFNEALAFIWLDGSNGLIIEGKKQVLYGEEDLHSISYTLENDFYIQPKFYIGKFRDDPGLLRESYFLERELFIKAIRLRSEERVFTFEKILPVLLTAELPKVPLAIIQNDIIPILQEDPELRKTLMEVLQNQSNVSLAAKRLFIHRNTLQYRIDKFSEKTGINLKDYHSALTVYFACLMTT